MKLIIKEIGRDKPVKVWMLYWEDNKRFHMVVPYEGYEGLIILSHDQVEIIDPSVNDFTLKKDDYGGEVLIHNLVNNGDLIYKMIDHDAEAMKEFERRLAVYE